MPTTIHTTKTHPFIAHIVAFDCEAWLLASRLDLQHLQSAIEAYHGGDEDDVYVNTTASGTVEICYENDVSKFSRNLPDFAASYPRHGGFGSDGEWINNPAPNGTCTRRQAVARASIVGLLTQMAKRTHAASATTEGFSWNG